MACALEVGDSSALAAFNDDLTNSGGPLIEASDTEPGTYLVTFVWPGPAEGVNVYSAVFGVVPRAAMMRLADTDLWFHTVTVAAGVETTYRFCPDEPQALPEVPRLTDVMATFGELGRGVYPALLDDDEIVSAALSLAEGRSRLNRADPFNSDRVYPILVTPIEDLPGELFDSVLSMPDAPAHPWVGERSGVARGEVTEHSGVAPVWWTHEHLGCKVPKEGPPPCPDVSLAPTHQSSELRPSGWSARPTCPLA